ncbi:MAG: GNAT family N-acetyltransferase [Hyphomicrobiales bacterium]|nr:GNAT family N-acetyltransferase [Hyphomicrobiales bacterium]
MQLREATPDDIPAIMAIYNDAVLHTTAIWNDTQVDAANRLAWMSQRQASHYPVLVADAGAEGIIGYASFGDWRAFDGYRHTVEHSVYVRADQRGNGIGKLLLEALIVRARDLGKHVMIAGIEAGNKPSIRLHERLGFNEVARMPQVGTKFGQWLDLVFLQLMLDHRTKPDLSVG